MANHATANALMSDPDAYPPARLMKKEICGIVEQMSESELLATVGIVRTMLLDRDNNADKLLGVSIGFKRAPEFGHYRNRVQVLSNEKLKTEFGSADDGYVRVAAVCGTYVGGPRVGGETESE